MTSVAPTGRAGKRKANTVTGICHPAFRELTAILRAGRKATLALTIPADPIPIHVDADGAARVGGTRVTLDTIVSVFNQGNSAEEIHADFPSLSLADIHTTIGFYLRHRAEVEAYLCERERLGAEIHKEVERRFNASGLREQILARRAERQKPT